MKYYVYPGHGIGKVVKTETKEIFGKQVKFIHLDILDSGMRILIPEDNIELAGLRELITKDQAKEVRKIMNEPSKIDNSNWNVRYRHYMEKIKTGNTLKVAEVYRDLNQFRGQLSFGERKMFDTAKYLLEKELELIGE